MKEIDINIKRVLEYLNTYYPDDYNKKAYTICVTLWNDEDYLIRLRHGMSNTDIEYHKSNGDSIYEETPCLCRERPHTEYVDEYCKGEKL